MCGLVGGTAIITKEERAVTYSLFMNNVVRGWDGCGFVVGYKDADKRTTYKLHKTTQPSSSFVNENPYQKHVMDSSGKIDFLAAHSRAATVGKVNRKNNHPFDFENLIGMHNGTAFGKYPLKDKYETDSEALFARMNEHGAKKGIEEFDKEATSFAYALVWVDKENDTLNLLRNNDRPLFIAKHKHIKGQIYWSSSSLILDYSLKLFGLSSQFDIESLAVNELQTYDLKNSYSAPEIQAGFITKQPRSWFTPAQDTRFNYNHNHNNNNYGRNNNHSGGSVVPKITHNPSSVSRGKIKGFEIGNAYYSEKMFLKILEKGCCMCTQPTTLINNNLDMKFIKTMPQEFICKPCLDTHSEDVLEMQYGIKPEDLITPEEYEIDGDV